MALSLSIEDLLSYTSGERAKWEQWFKDHPPAALDAPVQRRGDFNDVWRLMHHIFLTEKRHSQRLKQESPLMEQIGVARHDVIRLFAFGSTVREELIAFIHAASDADLDRTLEIRFRDQVWMFTARNLERLRRESFDVLVLGGGINGAGIARDLALRGVKVALVEQRHFASGTSGKNSQLIHGGLRYLKFLQFHLVRESLRERATLLKLAPHLVKPLPFLIPMYGWFAR